MKTTRLIVTVFAILAIGTLYLLLDPRVPTDAPAAPAGAPRTLTLNIDTPEPGVPPLAQVVKVMEGELVTLRIDSVLSGDVVQVEHGLRVPVEAGQPTQADFRAGSAGRYPIHFHATDGARHELGDLVVPPR